MAKDMSRLRLMNDFDDEPIALPSFKNVKLADLSSDNIRAMIKKRDGKVVGERKEYKRKSGEVLVLEKVNNGDYDLINRLDWVNYFIHKASTYGVTYIRGLEKRENAVIDSLMNNFKPTEIKTMMDFVWDAWDYPNGVSRATMQITIFSKGWINTIYNLTKEWQRGEYSPSKGKVKREWREVSPTEVTTSIDKPKRDWNALANRRKK